MVTDSNATVSRRNMLRTGAIALAAAPTLAVGGMRPILRASPLQGLSFAEWQQMNGGLVSIIGESGVVLAIVKSVEAMPAVGTRPGDLPRAFAFHVALELELPAAPAGNGLYEVWMGSTRSTLFLQRRSNIADKAQLTAVFN